MERVQHGKEECVFRALLTGQERFYLVKLLRSVKSLLHYCNNYIMYVCHTIIACCHGGFTSNSNEAVRSTATKCYSGWV